MGFSTPDYFIVAAYLIAIALFGILSGGKQTSARDYFLGGRTIPWWAVCFAVVATETSTLTFISIPGIAYTTNLNFLQLTFGYILGRIAIALFLLPAYYRGDVATAYTFLGKRFSPAVRNSASIVFISTRVLADGVRLYAAAIPISLVTGVGYPEAILITAAVTLAYTFTGGVRSVIWVDVIQMFVYLGGAFLAITMLSWHLPEGFSTLWSAPAVAQKISIVNWGLDRPLKDFFSSPYTFFASVLGGAFLSMASHGTDQLIVGRLLTADSLRSSRRAIVVSGFIIFIQFAVFLTVGLLLFAFYNGAKMDPNVVFPQYIIHSMPSGISGLIIAGLLAAAMSTLGGSMNALASTTLFDLFKPALKKELGHAKEILLSRLFTLLWGAILVVSALSFMNTPKTVVELALGIASFTYGGLLGTFLLGVLFRRVRAREALIAFGAGVLVMVFVILRTDIAWTWYTIIGTLTTVTVGVTLASFGRRQDPPVS